MWLCQGTARGHVRTEHQCKTQTKTNDAKSSRSKKAAVVAVPFFFLFFFFFLLCCWLQRGRQCWGRPTLRHSRHSLRVISGRRLSDGSSPSTEERERNNYYLFSFEKKEKRESLSCMLVFKWRSFFLASYRGRRRAGRRWHRRGAWCRFRPRGPACRRRSRRQGCPRPTAARCSRAASGALPSCRRRARSFRGKKRRKQRRNASMHV